MFAVASLAGALAQNGDPSEAGYRVFYLFGGILNVAWLALGTVVLVAPRWSRVALNTGKGYPDGSLPRILAAIGSGVGSVVLIGGALWSAWVFLRRRHNGRRAISNIVIAVGVFIVAAGGTATFTGATGILEFTNLIGVAVMFAGFLLA